LAVVTKVSASYIGEGLFAALRQNVGRRRKVHPTGRRCSMQAERRAYWEGVPCGQPL